MIDQSYLNNREKFIAAAHEAGAALTCIPCPLDASLSTDIAVIGADAAAQVIVVSSGLHGVELPAGSAVQQIWVREAKKVADARKDIRFVFVHALNPYGAVHALRTDSDAAGQNNIDPARNFVDFAAATTSADPDIAAAFAAADLSSPSLALMWGRLLYAAFVRQGQSAFKRHFVQGQFTDPLLPYYGGTQPCFARLHWDKIVRDFVNTPQVHTIWHMDIHTGDGPFGQLQLYVNGAQQSSAYMAAQRLIAPERVQLTGGYFADIKGDILDYWSCCGLSEGVAVHPMTLEYGTTQARIEGIDILGAILNRTLLQQKYGDRHPQAATIIQAMREAFAPQNPGWGEAVTSQAAGVWGKLGLILGVTD